MDESFLSSEEPSDATPPRKTGGDNNWILGAVLLLAGGIFLFNNLTGWKISNWWMLFLLIPALGSFATAWRRYQEVGRSKEKVVIRPVIIGLALLFIMVILLFEFEWRISLSMLLILVGAIFLLMAIF
jgi:hypothetical protein